MSKFPYSNPFGPQLYQLGKCHNVDDRESTPASISKGMIGGIYRVSRLVARIGYPVEHHDFNPFEVVDEGRALLRELIGSELFHLGKDESKSIANRIEASIHKRYSDCVPKYKARASLLSKKIKSDGIQNSNIRSIWYRDIGPQLRYSTNWAWCKVVGTQRFVTGEQYSGSAGCYGFDGWEDGESAGLANMQHHTLLHVRVMAHFAGNKDFSDKEFENYGCDAIVHPLDLFDKYIPGNEIPPAPVMGVGTSPAKNSYEDWDEF